MTTRKKAGNTSSTRVPAKKVPARKAPAAKAQTAGATFPASREERWHMVAEAAYYRAEQRNFADGDELADWLAAEREVDEQLAQEGRTPDQA